MKVEELIDYINENDGDITAININDDTSNATLSGVAGSTDCFYDSIVALPKGKYILLKAIDTIVI